MLFKHRWASCTVHMVFNTPKSKALNMEGCIFLSSDIDSLAYGILNEASVLYELLLTISNLKLGTSSTKFPIG